MKTLQHPLFIAIFLVALSTYSLQYFQLPLNFFGRNYLNDLLCMPLVLWICLAVARLVKNSATVEIPWFVGFALTACYALCFEWYLPQVNSRYTADCWDVFCYALGTLSFLGFQKFLKI